MYKWCQKKKIKDRIIKDLLCFVRSFGLSLHRLYNKRKIIQNSKREPSYCCTLPISLTTLIRKLLHHYTTSPILLRIVSILIQNQKTHSITETWHSMYLQRVKKQLKMRRDRRNTPCPIILTKPQPTKGRGRRFGQSETILRSFNPTSIYY